MTTMLQAFGADGPFPEYADELMTFGRFVGDWDFDVTNYPPDGEPERERGEWLWGWVLRGRAVQDVWAVPGRELGTTVRFYDPGLEAWRVVWNGPMYRRQIFSEIADDSFHWRARGRREARRGDRRAPRH